MPYLEVTEEKQGRPAGDVYDAVRELLAREKAKHPEWRFKDAPEFREAGSAVTAILGYHPRLDYVAPEETLSPPPETGLPPPVCGILKLNGQGCGRDLPCRYHKSYSGAA
tara:strand:+ start:6620 stop:6949 length:330 start_codon:yes stop_codon:yes gene_type:complete